MCGRIYVRSRIGLWCGMSPYYCHVGNHLYVSGPAEGCHDPACAAFRDVDVPPLGLLASTVEGGYNDSRGDVRYDFQKGFDKGLDAYAGARKEGLKPKSTTVAGVEAAQREVKSHQRGINKLRKAGVDTSELKTAAGVE